MHFHSFPWPQNMMFDDMMLVGHSLTHIVSLNKRYMQLKHTNILKKIANKMKHLKRQSCFPGQNILHGNLYSTSWNPTLIYSCTRFRLLWLLFSKCNWSAVQMANNVTANWNLPVLHFVYFIKSVEKLVCPGPKW